MPTLKDLLTTYWPVVVVLGGALVACIGFSVRVDSGISNISSGQREIKQDFREFKLEVRKEYRELSERIAAVESKVR